MAILIPNSILLYFSNLRVGYQGLAGKFLNSEIISGPPPQDHRPSGYQAGDDPSIAASTPRVRSLAVNGLSTIPWIPAWVASPTSSRLPCAVIMTTRSAGLSEDRKSTRLNSSHVRISYSGFC